MLPVEIDVKWMLPRRACSTQLCSEQSDPRMCNSGLRLPPEYSLTSLSNELVSAWPVDVVGGLNVAKTRSLADAGPGSPLPHNAMTMAPIAPPER